MGKPVGRQLKETDLVGGVTTYDHQYTVYVNGYHVIKKEIDVPDTVPHIYGHGLATHAAPHMVQGSSTVFVKGVAICREYDVANCGHPIVIFPKTPKDPNVYAGWFVLTI